MKALNKETCAKAQRPERIIQFGEGNFLRAFVDWIIYNMNEKTDFNSSVVVVQPIDKGMVDMLNAQDCLYHVNLQGLDKGEVVNKTSTPMGERYLPNALMLDLGLNTALLFTM